MDHSRQLSMDFCVETPGVRRVDVIVIDPLDQSIDYHPATQSVRSIDKLLKGRADRVHRLPTGDWVYKLRFPTSTKECTLGGSYPIQGKAIVVAKTRGAFLAKPKCPIEMLRQLVAF